MWLNSGEPSEMPGPPKPVPAPPNPFLDDAPGTLQDARARQLWKMPEQIGSGTVAKRGGAYTASLSDAKPSHVIRTSNETKIKLRIPTNSLRD